MSNTRGKETSILLIMQVICIALFGLFVDYDPSVAASVNSTTNNEELNSQLYPFYLDVHLMMLIGFGFLMTFLERHGYGSVGFNFLLCAYVIEWGTLVNGWFAMIGKSSKIFISTKSLLECDFALATVLISFGAILGVASPVQLTIMATIEVIIYNINLYVGVVKLQALDVGGSIFIHTFGAFFGLAVARMLYKQEQIDHDKEGSTYHSDIFAMIGTLFLWLYWPSFNSAPLVGAERQLAVINTILSLVASTITAFAISSSLNKNGKLDMVHIQNSTLSGGVAMGASANLVIHPFGALLIGTSSGLLTTLGYKYLQPFLQRTIQLHDTCGVHNLHGMPGILGAVASGIVWTLTATVSNGRTGIVQGGFQMAALGVAIGLGVAGGTLTGLLLKVPMWDNINTAKEMFEDDFFWECEDSEFSHYTLTHCQEPESSTSSKANN